MATFFTALTKNIMANAITITHASLHSRNPTPDGSDGELTSPSYSRTSASLLPAVDGVRYLESDVIFSVTAGDQVAYIGYWNGSTFVAAVELPVLDIADENKDLVLSTASNGLAVADTVG
jgi:hypothetical protein